MFKKLVINNDRPNDEPQIEKGTYDKVKINTSTIYEEIKCICNLLNMEWFKSVFRLIFKHFSH